jgi:predicted transcriptional regulator
VSKEQVLKVLSRGNRTRTQITEELRGIVSERSILAAVTALVVSGEIYQGEKRSGGVMLSLEPFKPVDQQIIDALTNGPMSCKDLAKNLGKHNSLIHFKLTELKEKKLVRSIGHIQNRMWHLTKSGNAMNSVMSDDEVEHLRKLVASQWRGTWLQGMECVL